MVRMEMLLFLVAVSLASFWAEEPERHGNGQQG
jgi:hypothetical protein